MKLIFHFSKATEDSMQSNLVKFPNVEAANKNTQTKEKTITKYDFAEEQFIKLLAMEDLDHKLDVKPAIANEFEQALSTAIRAAYKNDRCNLQ